MEGRYSMSSPEWHDIGEHPKDLVRVQLSISELRAQLSISELRAQLSVSELQLIAQLTVWYNSSHL